MVNQRERRNQNNQLNHSKERDNIYSQIRTINLVKPEIEDLTIWNIYLEAKQKNPKLTFKEWCLL